MANDNGGGAGADYSYDFKALQSGAGGNMSGQVLSESGGVSVGGGNNQGIGQIGGGQASMSQGGMGVSVAARPVVPAAWAADRAAKAATWPPCSSRVPSAAFDLPGVTAQSLFAGVNPNDHGGGSGGTPFADLGNSASSGAYGGNRFADLGSNQGNS